MSEKEKESLFEELERLKEEDRQDFLWYAVFGILKSDLKPDVDKTNPETNANNDESDSKSDMNDKQIGNHETALQKCIELAYRDFNRTLRFKKDVDEEQRKSWREECIEVVSSGISKILEDGPSQFDSNHKEICSELCKKANQSGSPLSVESEFVFTIGHAQKWVNMTLKYMLIMDIPDWKMSDLESYLHVPIDNYILRYVYKTYKKEWGAYKLSDNVCIYADGKIKIGPKEDPKEYSWSKISDYDKHYKPIQDHLMGLAYKKSKCPIAWENPAWLMAAKWQQEKDERNKKSKTSAT